MVRSVTLLHQRVGLVLPLHHDVDPLEHPQRTGVTKPHSAFIEECYSGAHLDGYTTTESTVAELFVFENAKSAKKLEVFVWTFDEECPFEGDDSLNYAFLLRVADL